MAMRVVQFNGKMYTVRYYYILRVNDPLEMS